MWAGLSTRHVWCRSVQHTKKPKVQIKRLRTSLGMAYRIYINGQLMAAAFTPAEAREALPRMLQIYEKANNRALKSAIASSRLAE